MVDLLAHHDGRDGAAGGGGRRGGGACAGLRLSAFASLCSARPPVLVPLPPPQPAAAALLPSDGGAAAFARERLGGGGGGGCVRGLARYFAAPLGALPVQREAVIGYDAARGVLVTMAVADNNSSDPGVADDGRMPPSALI